MRLIYLNDVDFNKRSSRLRVQIDLIYDIISIKKSVERNQKIDNILEVN